MNLTISSVMSTYVLGSTLILAFCGILRKDGTIRRAGSRCVVMILVVLLIRMLIPMELPFMYTVRVFHVLPAIKSVLVYEILPGKYPLKIGHMVLLLWGLGIIYGIWKRLRFQKALGRIFGLMKEKRLKNGASVIVTDLVTSPCLVGIRKPRILLPKNSYTEEELDYILRHEAIHIQKRDVLKKVSLDFLCILFWWNPAVHYLKNTVFHMIEISSDMEVTKEMSGQEKIRYMECLKSAAEKVQTEELPAGISFVRGSVRELGQRMRLIGREPGSRKGFSLGLKAAAAAMVLLSLCFILEACYMPPEDGEGEWMTKENTYLIENGEDYYDVYFHGEYCFSTDDLRPFRGVTVYKSEEDVKDE